MQAAEVRTIAQARADELRPLYDTKHGKEPVIEVEDSWCPECSEPTIVERIASERAPLYCTLCQVRFELSHCFICGAAMVGAPEGGYWI